MVLVKILPHCVDQASLELGGGGGTMPYLELAANVNIALTLMLNKLRADVNT